MHNLIKITKYTLGLISLLANQLTTYANNSITKINAETAAMIELEQSSIIDRALNSGLVVWLVLLTLVALSVFSWGIFLAKWIYLRRLYKKDKIIVQDFWKSDSLEQLYQNSKKYPNSPIQAMFTNGYKEFVRISASPKNTRLSEDFIFNTTIDNLFRCLEKTKQNYRQHMNSGVWFLAVCASTAPFIGLFGTVWGIMEAFDAIAKSGVSSLSAVAPGISEALVATAFGLSAAIPAVVGYNYIQTYIKRITLHADEFMSDFVSLIQKHFISPQ